MSFVNRIFPGTSFFPPTVATIIPFYKRSVQYEALLAFSPYFT